MLFLGSLCLSVALGGAPSTGFVAYLQTGKPFPSAPERPIGPRPLAEVESYLRALDAAGARYRTTASLAPHVSLDVVRFCLTSSSADLLRRLPSARGEWLRELVVETHRRRLPTRGRAYVAGLRSTAETNQLGADHLALGLVSLGGDAGREAAALLAGDPRWSVRYRGAKHLAELGDPRAFAPLARLVRESAKEQTKARLGNRHSGVNAFCAAYLIRHGFADRFEDSKLLMGSLSYLDFRGVIHTLANRGSSGTQGYLANLCSSAKANHGLKSWAVKAMAAADRKAHTPVLRRLLSDPWALVRNEAARELVRRRDLGALPLMRKAAKMGDEANRINGTPDRDANAPVRGCIEELERLART